MRYWYLSLLIVFSVAHASEPVTITVFEDHDRYVQASDSYGLSWRLFELGAKHQGIDLVPIESSWKASMKRLHAERIDMVFAALKTEERQVWANFSLPLTNEGSGIFTRFDNPVKTFEQIDLSTSSIGVSSNSVQEGLAKELGFANIYSTVQRPQLYEMLRAGRVDYLFFGKSIAAYYCVYFDPSRSRNCMKQVGDLYFKNNVYAIALQKNSRASAILEQINIGIHAISETDSVKQLFVDYEKPANAYPNWLAHVRQTLSQK